MKNLLNRTIRLTAIAFLPAGFFALALPNGPAVARNQFDVCVERLMQSGVSGEQAGTACADAIIPKELSWCVRKIREKTTIPAEDVLKACYRVRRPVDLGNCVADINQKIPLTAATPPTEESSDTAQTTDSPLMQALDSCRRSLLPGRYSECVIALSRDIQGSTPAEAMKTCLDAQDFPRDLFPSYTNN